MAKKTFHISDVLAITTGRNVSTRGMDGVSDVLGFMIGSDLFTHQLPSVMTVVHPEVLRQHPHLAEVKVPDFGGDAGQIDTWTTELGKIYGNNIELDNANIVGLPPVGPTISDLESVLKTAE